MMKHVLILFSMSFEPYQGRYQRVYNEAVALIKNGNRVTVLAWDRSGKSPRVEVRDAIHIQRIRTSAPDSSSLKSLPRFLGFARSAIATLKKMPFDILHCHNLQLLPLGYYLKRTKKVPLIFDSCEPDYFALYPNFLHGGISFLEKVMSRQADVIFVHNEYQLQKYCRMGNSRVLLIGSYPTMSMLENTVEKPVNQDKIIIGRIGSIYHDNGIEEILEAFRLLVKRDERVFLFLAGRVFDAYQEEFDRLTAGMEDRVIVHGKFDSSEMASLYSQIDLSIMVYKRSLWFKNITPTKFFDSLAFGVPVIVSDMGGLKEILARYQCGVVVDERNPEAVADAVHEVIENQELRYRMGLTGKQAIKDEFNWERMQKKLIKAYGDLLS